MDDRCQIPRCRRPADVSYLGHGICSEHWTRLTNENAPADALRMALGIAAAHEPEPEDTMSKKKTQPTEHPAETPHADVAAVLERKGKTPNPEKAARPEKTREPKPKEGPLVVFAFRLTPEERDLIHKAAGPARASRFVRTVAIAAAAEDESAIRTAIREAKEARS